MLLMRPSVSGDARLEFGALKVAWFMMLRKSVWNRNLRRSPKTANSF
jgi:hypothetical protein